MINFLCNLMCPCLTLLFVHVYLFLCIEIGVLEPDIKSNQIIKHISNGYNRWTTKNFVEFSGNEVNHKFNLEEN